MIRAIQANVTGGLGSGTHLAKSLPPAACTGEFDALRGFSEVFLALSRLDVLEKKISQVSAKSTSFACFICLNIRRGLRPALRATLCPMLLATCETRRLASAATVMLLMRFLPSPARSNIRVLRLSDSQERYQSCLAHRLDPEHRRQSSDAIERHHVDAFGAKRVDPVRRRQEQQAGFIVLEGCCNPLGDEPIAGRQHGGRLAGQRRSVLVVD